MTAAAANVEPQDEPIPEFTSARGLQNTDRIPFKLDGDCYALLRPKLSMMIGMIQLVEAPELNRSSVTVGTNLARLLLNLIDYIEKELPEPPFLDAAGKRLNPKAGQLRGRDRIYERLNDTTDGFDLTDLMPIVRALADKAFPDRPTGALPAQLPEQRSSDSVASVVATRSRPAKTSGKRRAASS
jgi:hypothetical protein